MYDEDGMLARIDTDIMHAGRRSQYTKLWRVDEELDVLTWKALINDYFRDNRLVGEYLGGKEEADEVTRPRVIQLNSGTASVVDFAPCTMKRGDGVRIAISYHAIASSLSGHRVIEPTRELESPTGARAYVEDDTVDLIKLLRRRGEIIEWPDNTIHLAFEDFVLGLPLIAHYDSDAVNAAQRTQHAIVEYCAALSKNGEDRMLGYHLGVRLSDREVIFSFAGHVDDLNNWFQSGCSRLPVKCEAIGQWAGAAIEELSRLFPSARDIPPLENMFRASGLLSLERKMLSPDEFTVIRDADGSPLLGLEDRPNIIRAIPLIRSAQITVAPIWHVIASVCDRCGAAYESCGCIKLVDDEFSQNVIEAEPIGFFWTDRSALHIEPELPTEDQQRQSADFRSEQHNAK
jgi:hypothetical protein